MSRRKAPATPDQLAARQRAWHLFVLAGAIKQLSSLSPSDPIASNHIHKAINELRCADLKLRGA